MELTRSLVEEKAREYREHEPLYAVEAEHTDIVPRTFAGDEYGWRDLEWPVQWYYRRHLGGYPDRERREAESAFRENDFGAVAAAIDAVLATEDDAERVRSLTALDAVDVPVASAFLTFTFPAEYVVVGEREWGTLRAAGELDGAYPDPPSVEEYCGYLERCRDLRDRFDVDAWELYRALWRLSSEATG